MAKDDHLKQNFNYHCPRIYWQYFIPEGSLPVSSLLIFQLVMVL